jgi:hypothetical protein
MDVRRLGLRCLCDTSQAEALLDQIDDPIGQFTADGAYDGNPTYDAVTRHSAGAAVVIPPRANAVERPNSDLSCQRDRHIAPINADGRMKWQAATDYGKQSLVETAIGRYKSIIGHRLRHAHSPRNRRKSPSTASSSRMLACARPKSVRCVTAVAYTLHQRLKSTHSSTDATTPFARSSI